MQNWGAAARTPIAHFACCCHMIHAARAPCSAVWAGWRCRAARMHARSSVILSQYSAPTPAMHEENKDYISSPHTHAVACESSRRPLFKPVAWAAREMQGNWAAGGWTARSSWLRLVVTSHRLHPFRFPRTGFPPVLWSSPLFPVAVNQDASPPPPSLLPAPWLALAIPGVRCNMNQDMPALKTYSILQPRPSPLWHDAGLFFCLHPLNNERIRACE